MSPIIESYALPKVETISAQARTLKPLIARMRDSGYTFERIAGGLGKDFCRYSNYNDWEKQLVRCCFSDDIAAPFVRLFLIGERIAVDLAREKLGTDLLERLMAVEFIHADANECWSAYRMAPFESIYIITDGTNIDDSFVYPVAQEQSYIAKVAKMARARLRGPARILDLCCGSGALGLATAQPGDLVHGFEINPRAVTLAKLNAEINDISAEFVLRDLSADQVEGQFDLIISNPPYNAIVGDTEWRKTSHSNQLGMEIPRRVLDKIADDLSENGIGLVISTWLLQGSDIAWDRLAELKARGANLLLHNGILPLDTFEGLKHLLLWNDSLPSCGVIKSIVKEAKADAITFGIFAHIRGTAPSHFMLENRPADAYTIGSRHPDIQAFFS